MKIVTFCCQSDKIFIYHDNCNLVPMFPYKKYKNLNEAIKLYPNSKIIEYKQKG